jgi:hypothetical protein
MPGDGAAAADAGPRGGQPYQVAEYPRRTVDAVILLAGPGAAHRCEQRAVRGHQRHVGLAVAAVDGEHGGVSHARPPVCA